MAKPTSPAIAATTLSSRALPECCRRVAVDRHTDAFRGRDIVAVAHGGSIRAALAIALSLDPQAVLAFAVENCSLTRLDYFEGQSGSGWRIGTVNQQPWRDREPGWRSGETSPRHPARLRVGGSFQTVFSQEATQPSVNAAGER